MVYRYEPFGCRPRVYQVGHGCQHVHSRTKGPSRRYRTNTLRWCPDLRWFPLNGVLPYVLSTGGGYARRLASSKSSCESDWIAQSAQRSRTNIKEVRGVSCKIYNRFHCDRDKHKECLLIVEWIICWSQPEARYHCQWHGGGPFNSAQLFSFGLSDPTMVLCVSVRGFCTKLVISCIYRINQSSRQIRHIF